MEQRSAGNFFSFRWMITPGLIKTIYIAGAVVITLMGLGIVFGVAVHVPGPEGEPVRHAVGGIGVLVGLVYILLGNLLWRLWCEFVIVIFSMHELLGSIDRKLGARSGQQA